MSYKSKHTGAQVDEAISKVLNGEVGGGATPDWNAQYGEAGYIENRPFYDNINNKFDINDFEERIETEEEFGETYTYSVYTTTIHNFNRDNLAIKVKDLGIEDYDYYFIRYEEEKYIYTSNGGITIKPSSDNEYIIIEIVDPANLQNCLDNLYYKLYENYYNNYIKHINNAFLPDTVIKTTPQTLSSTNKNQALSNLGIDPVVWEYMCNPFMVTTDYTISDEVHNMIWDKEASSLRSVILNTAQVLYNGQPHKINKLISTKRLGIITSDGEVIYEYDYKIKQFKIVE